MHKLEQDHQALRKLCNQVYVWSKHDRKEDDIKLPTTDTNFCPYKVVYDSADDDDQSASDEVLELVLQRCDQGSNKPVSPEKGENQSLPVSAMKGEMHATRETVDAQGEIDNNDKLPCLIPQGTPRYKSGDESKDEEDVID